VTLPRVGIVLVNWKGCPQTIECLESLRSLTYGNYFVIVVDNASPDGSEETLRQRYPEHTVIQSDSNRGFAGGSNFGIRHALCNAADYVLLLNNDTRVDKMLLDHLVRCSESNTQIGLTGGRIDYMSPPDKVWACGGCFNVNTGQAKHFLSEAEFKAFDCHQAWYRYLPACLVLVRRRCFEELGLLSERFFHLAEDVDFCLRAQRNGWLLALAPDARVFHRGSASLPRFSPLYNYYEQRNRLMIIREYRMPGNSVCATLKDALVILSRITLTLATVDRFSHVVRGAWFLLLAVHDFLRGKEGHREDYPPYHTIPAVSERGSCRREGDL